MDIIIFLFGNSDPLSLHQMMLRSVVTFFIALILIRIAGRRTFGMRAPLDNIIIILFGAVLGRAIVGASPYFPTVGACLMISILHRLLAYLSVHYSWIGRFVKGRKISLLIDENKLNKKNMARALASKEDIMEELRLRMHSEKLEDFAKIYMERSGEISAIKKDRCE